MNYLKSKNNPNTENLVDVQTKLNEIKLKKT